MGRERNNLQQQVGIAFVLGLASLAVGPTLAAAQETGAVLVRFGVDRQALGQVDLASVSVDCRAGSDGIRCDGRYPTAQVEVCQAAAVTTGLDRRQALVREGSDPTVSVRLECRGGIIVLFRSSGARALLASSDAEGRSTQRQIPL